MKIISVKILGDHFRSLEPNKLYEFNASLKNDRLSTKVFAGLNGSGKSNFLELFSEIFYYLEIVNLATVGKAEKLGKNIGFTIDYLLPINAGKVYTLLNPELASIAETYTNNNFSLTPYTKEQFEVLYNTEIESQIYDAFKNKFEAFVKQGYIYVKISKELGELPIYSIRNHDNISESQQINRHLNLLLPKRVIAYTSGQNELLSNPYYKIKYHYFKEFVENEPGGSLDLIEENRLFFLDYTSNFSIFISNMLLTPQNKLQYLTDTLDILNLTSFRITINLVDIYKKTIPVTEKLLSDIEKLKSCATSWTSKKQNKESLLVMDYLVTEATKEAFRFHFKTSFSLFKLFYELDILNLHLVRKDTRSLMLRVHRRFNFLDELPKPDPSRLIFRIEQIEIEKRFIDKRTRKIYYKGLSDGEHQFNEVIGTVMMMEHEGCLFLMDEPDTHFNPKWRAKLIEVLNLVTAKTYVTKERFKLDAKGNRIKDAKGKIIKEQYQVPDSVRRQEIIMTTHSPFVISDSQKYDVYKFDKINGAITYMNPQIETYGTSINLLLQEIFDRKISISDLSQFDMDEYRQEFMKILASTNLRTKADRIMKKINEVKSHLIDFGESIEKFDLFSFITQVEQEVNRK